jgi:hypothetical protein
MTEDVESPLENRLRATLAEVAEHVSVDPLPAMWSDDVRRTPSRRARAFAMAALAAALAVGVGFAVDNARSTNDARPTPASVSPSTTPRTKAPTRAIALECPSKPKTVDHLRTAGRATTMVPGKPIALVACRYHGFNQPEPAGLLAKSALMDPARLANDLNAQPPLPPGLVENCPADFGERIDLLFGYADGSRLRISVHTSGCGFATNGVRAIRMDPIELARLQHVLGKDASPSVVDTTPSTNDTQPTQSSIPPSTTPSTSTSGPECPSSPPRTVQPHQIPGTDTTLVPGTPTALLACRYHGLNQPEPIGTLAKAAGFDPGPIAAGLNSQPANPPGPPGAVHSCPADFGEVIVLLFAYDDTSTLTVSISVAGCRDADNGDRGVPADPATMDELQAVLGKDAFP